MTALPLAEQQRLLHRAIVAGGDVAGGGLLRAQPGRQDLLRVYQHAHGARLVAALRDNHGVLPRAMGDDAFDTLAAAYVAAHPSRQPSIRWFGHRLADFMAAHAELVPHPAFVDLARMEWALRGAFDAPDAPPLEAADLVAVAPNDWPGLVLRLHPSAVLLRLQWGIEPAWRALQQADGQDSDPELDEPPLDEHLLIVWRPALETRWRSASSGLEAAMLQAVAEGRPFGALCELAAGHVGEDQAATAAVGCLHQWVAEGLLAA